MATPEQLALFRKQTKELLTPAETKDVKEALGEFMEDKVQPVSLLCCLPIRVASCGGIAAVAVVVDLYVWSRALPRLCRPPLSCLGSKTTIHCFRSITSHPAHSLARLSLSRVGTSFMRPHSRFFL